MSLPEMRS